MIKYCSVLGKKDIMPFAITWLNLEDTVLMKTDTKEQILHDLRGDGIRRCWSKGI